jgi:hypothetical protein
MMVPKTFMIWKSMRKGMGIREDVTQQEEDLGTHSLPSDDALSIK